MASRFTSHRLRAAKAPASKPVAAPAEPEGSKAKTGTPPITPKPKEIGGPSGPEPTRYGDWERKGICYDF